MTRVLVLLALAVVVVFAADVTGSWTGTIDSEFGTFPVAAKLKADGNSITGTVSSESGDLKIEKGEMNGDNISFQVTGDYGPMVYAGTISGDEMKLTVEVMGYSMPASLKRETQ